MKLDRRLFIVFIIAWALIPGACAISIGGGTSVSISGSSSAEGSFVADNNGATFSASSTGILDNFQRDEQLGFDGKSIIESAASINGGSIGTYSEITKPTVLGTKTSTNLIAQGTSVDVALSGAKDSKEAYQAAYVGNGILSSSLNLVIDDDIVVRQSTRIVGDVGATRSSSNSAENNMAVAGAFSGSGDLNAELTSIAADRAGIHGTNSFNGQEVVNDNLLQTVNDGEFSVSVDGIYEDRKGDLGNFAVTASSKASNKLALSQSNVAFQTAGYAWAAPIHYKLSTNLIGSSTSANAKLWLQEISKGANQWDSNTAKNVFKGSDTTNTPGPGNVLEFTTFIPNPGTYYGGTGDGNNNYMAVTTAVTGSTIGLAYTWYYTDLYVTGWDGDPYQKAAESDVYFNANKYWRVATGESTLTNSKFDVRTIATHEVGHSLGLLDLYGSKDANKIMYGYNNGQVKWYLRNADKLGLWSLYGL